MIHHLRIYSFSVLLDFHHYPVPRYLGQFVRKLNKKCSKVLGYSRNTAYVAHVASGGPVQCAVRCTGLILS